MPGRSDNVTDPELAAALMVARRGQAYFSRKLNELRDVDFDAPSLLPGWSRRHIVAHVGYNARANARLVEWAATGIETPMYDSPSQRQDEIEFGATLPVEALRNLSAHAAVHLNVEWRDLPEARWAFPIVTAQGRTAPVRETVWMRTREVWLHAVDLDNGGSVSDFPVELVDRLLEDLIAVWRRKRAATKAPNVILEPTDRDVVLAVDDDPAAESIVARGTAVDLVAWGTGRSRRGVTTPDGRSAPPAPTWL